jgi:hypothetical protein
MISKLRSPVISFHTASLTFNNSTFCSHTLFMCFVWIKELTAIFSLYSINWLVFISMIECVYCAVRTGSSYKTHNVSSLKVLSNTECVTCKWDLNMSDRLYIYPACDTNGNILWSKNNTSTNTVHSRQCRAHTLARYCKIISLLGTMAGGVEFTPTSPAVHLPNYSCGKSGHSAVHIKPYHECDGWQSMFTAPLQGRTQDSRIWQQVCAYNKEVHLFLHQTIKMQAQKIPETLNWNRFSAHLITQKALSSMLWYKNIPERVKQYKVTPTLEITDY